MDILEYRGFKNIFIGLVKWKDKYCIVYGKTGPAQISSSDEKIDVFGGITNSKLLSFNIDTMTQVEIPFVPNRKNLYTFISISNRTEYYNIVSMLEDLLND